MLHVISTFGQNGRRGNFILVTFEGHLRTTQDDTSLYFAFLGTDKERFLLPPVFSSIYCASEALSICMAPFKVQHPVS